jgi:hypothetical protein
MAATTLTVQEITRSGINPALTAANVDGHTISNEGRRTFFYVYNGGGSEITVTFATPNTVDDLAVADREVSVPAGEYRMAGPFPTAYYGTTLAVTFSAVTSVTCGAFKAP